MAVKESSACGPGASGSEEFCLQVECIHWFRSSEWGVVVTVSVPPFLTLANAVTRREARSLTLDVCVDFEDVRTHRPLSQCFSLSSPSYYSFFLPGFPIVSRLHLPFSFSFYGHDSASCSKSWGSGPFRLHVGGDMAKFSRATACAGQPCKSEVLSQEKVKSRGLVSSEHYFSASSPGSLPELPEYLADSRARQ